MEKLKTDVESLIRYLCKDEVRFYCDNISYNEVISILKRVLKKRSNSRITKLYLKNKLIFIKINRMRNKILILHTLYTRLSTTLCTDSVDNYIGCQ